MVAIQPALQQADQQTGQVGDVGGAGAEHVEEAEHHPEQHKTHQCRWQSQAAGGLQLAAQPAVAEQGIDHAGEAAKQRAAGKELGDIGQGGAHQQQDQQLAAAEALLDLTAEIPPPEQVEHQMEHREVDQGGGEIAPRLPVGELGQRRVECQLIKNGQADGLDPVDGETGDDDHQRQWPRLMEEVGDGIRHPLAVVDAGIGAAGLPGGFHIARVARLGQKALHLQLGLSEA
ncbi:hypothetical protein AERO8C_70285 [Aeromonas veronii]|uniref:Uncharacterized protein n=1 Tax=Aeromonas veronii TaxID=654 RepID=A0A653LCD6_AERVE|nr:hypothetical protein AERO8C_70285 [Aeromonas veronii]